MNYKFSDHGGQYRICSLRLEVQVIISFRHVFKFAVKITRENKIQKSFVFNKDKKVF